MVCRGANCNVTFTSCNFDSCKLVAIDGAQISLVNPLFEASTSEIGLLARGAGTRVEATNSIIIDGIQSASAQAGALIALQDCSCSGASVVWVEVRGEGSRIKLRGSFVGKVSSRSATPRNGPGLHSSAACMHLFLQRCIDSLRI